jgi:hypothetical protein
MMSREKKAVALVCGFLFVTCLFSAFMMERVVPVTQYGHGVSSFDMRQPVQYTETQSLSSAPKKLKAEVKGSIYETGSNMTVFGACYDGDGYLLSDANASFTAWYPNGSFVTGPNASMLPVEDYNLSFGGGRWLIHVTMGSTIGTYLTEMRCDWQGQWAVAYGEWQNPEWVKKIGDTYLAVGNINTTVNNISASLANVSAELSIFHNETTENFGQVITLINSIATNITNGSGLVTQQSINELSNLIHSIDMNLWMLDVKNPFYVLASGVNNLYGVDILNPYSVHAVGDGIAIYWDGVSWQYHNLSGTMMNGVSILPANMQYAWYVGKFTGNNSPAVSINGNGPYQPTLPGDTSTGLTDVRIFQRPNDPSGAFYGYLMANDGRVYFSNDSGVSWTYAASVGSGTNGRISVVIENAGEDAEVGGYAVMFGQGDKVTIYDDGVYTSYNVSGDVRGVSLLHGEEGYAVMHGVDDYPYVFKFSGIALNLTQIYKIEDLGVEPQGIDALASNDIWMVTRDPSTFYHFNGDVWDYSTVPFSSSVSVIISFGNATNFTGGIHDVSMLNGKFGYAVGNDGLVLIFKNHYDQRLDDLLANLTAQISNVSVNLSPVLTRLTEINMTTQQTLSIVQAMNLTLYDMSQAMAGNFTQVNNKLDAMNLTLVQQTTVLMAINDTVVSIGQNQTLMQQFLYQMNLSMNQSFIDIANMIQTMNASIHARFDTIELTLLGMNLKLDDIQDALAGNFTIIIDKLDAMNLSEQDEMAALVQINQTLNDFRAETGVSLSYINATTLTINSTVNDIKDIVLGLNASFTANLTAIMDKIDAMNASIQYKLDNILTNVTFTNLYLQTTMFPMLNATYENTLQILTNLGIISAQVNQTILLQNQTLSIVNETQQDVSELVNRSRRIKAWTTQ